jgi:hypothetical protein
MIRFVSFRRQAIWDEQHYYAIHVPPASSAHWRRLLQRIVARFGAKNIVVMSGTNVFLFRFRFDWLNLFFRRERFRCLVRLQVDFVAIVSSEQNSVVVYCQNMYGFVITTHLLHRNVCSVVAAMLVGIERLLRMSNDWDLFINLSGTESFVVVCLF